MTPIFGLLCHYFFVIKKKVQFSVESYESLKFCPASWLLSIIMNIQPWVLFFGPSATYMAECCCVLLPAGTVFVCFFLFLFFHFLVNTWMLSTGTVFYYIYMGVLTSCMFVQHIHVMPPELLDPLEHGVPCGCWETNPDPLEEHPVS